MRPLPGFSLFPKVCGCMETNVKYDGPGVILDDVENVFKCQGLCQGTVGCHHFTYEIAEQVCYLLSEVERKKPLEGAISGTSNACN